MKEKSNVDIKKEIKSAKGCAYNITGFILSVLALIYVHKTCGYDFLGSIGETFTKLNDVYSEFFSVIFS